MNPAINAAYVITNTAKQMKHLFICSPKAAETAEQMD
jgi:hypothetical protein